MRSQPRPPAPSTSALSDSGRPRRRDHASQTVSSRPMSTGKAGAWCSQLNLPTGRADRAGRAFGGAEGARSARG
jgi:hypothetical protein